MAKRNSKKRNKTAKKPRKTMKMAAKTAAKKSAKSRKKRMGKPAKKVGKKAHTSAKKQAGNSPIMIPIKTKKAMPADPANPLGIRLPAMPFAYSRDSVMNALVVMLILFAVLSAGIFYPQIKAPEQALMAAPATMQKK